MLLDKNGIDTAPNAAAADVASARGWESLICVVSPSFLRHRLRLILRQELTAMLGNSVVAVVEDLRELAFRPMTELEKLGMAP